MPKKKETFYFAKKKNRILAFKTMQERNFWVYENDAEPVNRIEIKELATPIAAVAAEPANAAARHKLQQSELQQVKQHPEQQLDEAFGSATNYD